MEAALIARLVGAAAVNAIVAKDVAGDEAISWFGRQPKDELPALTLTLVSPGREWTHSGPDNLDRPRVQIDCWADTSTEAAALALAVRAEMEQARDQSGVRFHPAMLAGAQWADEEELDGGARIFRISQDWLFYYEEILT